MTHAGSLGWTAGLYGGVEGHDHLLGFDHILSGVLLGDLFGEGGLLLGVEFEGVLIVLELELEAEVGADSGPAGADVFDGGCEGHLVLFHVVGDDKCG